MLLSPCRVVVEVKLGRVCCELVMMKITKNYLTRMEKRIERDLDYLFDEKEISANRHAWFLGNIQAEIIWLKQRLEKKK